MADQLKPIQWVALPEVVNASPAMQMVDDPDLGVIQVPAGMDPGAFAAATAGARAEAKRKRQMQANMGTLGQIVAPLMEGPTQVYPQAAPVAAMAMGPNYQSFRQGQQQQIAAVAARKAEQERNALLEKQELARLQEQEKDRRQRLQVEMMRIKNDKDESAIRQQFDRAKMEQERMIADARREDAERDRIAKEQLARDQMESREKVAGMRAAARGGGGGGDGKRAAAHQKYLQDRYKEYRDRFDMESSEAWAAAEADAKRFYPEFYPEQKTAVRDITRSSWDAAMKHGNPAVQKELQDAKASGRVRVVEDPVQKPADGAQGQIVPQDSAPTEPAVKTPAVATTPAGPTPQADQQPYDLSTRVGAGAGPNMYTKDFAPQVAPPEAKAGVPEAVPVPTAEDLVSATRVRVGGESGVITKNNVFYTDAEWKSLLEKIAAANMGG